MRSTCVHIFTYLAFLIRRFWNDLTFKSCFNSKHKKYTFLNITRHCIDTTQKWPAYQYKPHDGSCYRIQCGIEEMKKLLNRLSYHTLPTNSSSTRIKQWISRERWDRSTSNGEISQMKSQVFLKHTENCYRIRILLVTMSFTSTARSGWTTFGEIRLSQNNGSTTCCWFDSTRGGGGMDTGASGWKARKEVRVPSTTPTFQGSEM